MIQVKNLTITHRKDLRCLVRDFSWVLNPGDKAVLIGEEGNGKSTFLKLLYNEQLVDDYAEYSGEIIKNGETITRQNPHGGQLLKKKMHAVKSLGRRLERESAQQLLEREDIHAVYMPQNYEDVLEPEKTPVEFICVSGDREELCRIRTFLGSMKFTPDEMDHACRELSGGQKAKLFFIKMLLSGCNVLILDEPTRNFSPLSGPVIRRLLSAFPGAIISISHDRKYIREVCTALYRLSESGLERADRE